MSHRKTSPRKAQDYGFNPAELAQLTRLDSPGEIQAFLDDLTYSSDPIYRSPRRVLVDRRAHCFDGALFAAAALRLLGYPPLLLDLRAERDDDHVLAIFRERGRFGAVAKSNFVGLRFREPIYGSLRELALTYFEFYYNLEGLKSLRGYSIPLDLRPFDRLHWMTEECGLEIIAGRLDAIRHYPLLTQAMIAALRPIDQRTYDSGMVGVNEAGIYRPSEHE